MRSVKKSMKPPTTDNRQPQIIQSERQCQHSAHQRKLRILVSTHLRLVDLGAREPSLGETAQHQKRHFPNAMTFDTTVFEELTNSIALAGRAAHPGVGVTGAEGKSRVEPERDPEELSGERFFVFREGLKGQHPRKKSVCKMLFFLLYTRPMHEATSHVMDSKSVREQTVQAPIYAVLPTDITTGRPHLCHRKCLFGNLHSFSLTAEKCQQLNVRAPQPQVRCARLTCLNKESHALGRLTFR